MKSTFYNLLLILLSVLPWLKAESKAYQVDGTYQIEDIYDFECDGLYYEFAGENDVYLVREKSVMLHLDSESIFREPIWKDAYYFQEENVCYTGNIVIPDSVEYKGKKYRVAAVNHYALSFSRGLKSVTFTSDINFTWRPQYDSETRPFFFNESLESVVYPDCKTEIINQITWASSLKTVHFPYNLTKLSVSLTHTGISEVDLDNHGEYNPSCFTVRNCFDNSPNLKKIKFPECDTLIIDGCSLAESHKLEQIVFRPCNMLILPCSGEIFYHLYYTLDYPIKTISESMIPPVVDYYDDPSYNIQYRSKAILYVPDEAIEDYKTADYWQDFGEIRPMSEYLAEEEAAIDGPIVDVDGVAEVEMSSNGSELTLSVSVPTEVTVWSLQGQAVWRGKVVDEAAITLPHDVYIITTPNSVRKYRH